MRDIVARRPYLWGLDLVRFSAAVLVAFFHLTWDDEQVWFGWIGVQVFFVISGFVIAQSANNTTPLKFARSRFLRLYPTAWLCAAAGLLVIPATSHQPDHLLQRFVDSMLLFPTGPFLGSAYWTLPVEIAFYVLIFLVLLGGIFNRLLAVAAVLCTASSLYIAAYALQQAGYLGGPDLDFGYGWPNLSLLRHGIYFASGILIWLWSERCLTLLGRAMLVLAFIAAPVEISCRTAELSRFLSIPSLPSLVWLVPVVLYLGCSALIAGSARWEVKIPRPPATVLHAMRTLGLVTYPLYLMHESVGIPVRNALTHLHLPFVASAAASVALTAALALLVVQFPEPWLRKLLQQILNSTATRRGDELWLKRLSRPGGVL